MYILKKANPVKAQTYPLGCYAVVLLSILCCLSGRVSQNISQNIKSKKYVHINHQLDIMLHVIKVNFSFKCL